VFGLFWHGNLFCVCSSKTTLQSSRIATARSLPNKSWVILLTPTVGIVGIRPRHLAELNLPPTSFGSLRIRHIMFRVTIFLNMHLIFNHAIFPSRKHLQINSKTEAAFSTSLTNRCASGNQKTVPKFTKIFAVSRCTYPQPLACKCMSATNSVYSNTDLGAS